jgi:hypothetical protein
VDDVRELTVQTTLAQGYGGRGQFESTRAIGLTTAAASGDPNCYQVETKLIGLGDAMTKTLYALVMQMVGDVVALAKRDDEDGSKLHTTRATVRLTAGGDGSMSRQNSFTVASVSIAAEVADLADIPHEQVVECMATSEAAAIAIIRDILVANDITQPIPDIVTGPDALQLASLRTAETSVRDVSEEIERAIVGHERAKVELDEARRRLATATAQLQETQATG